MMTICPPRKEREESGVRWWNSIIMKKGKDIFNMAG
jgi:hypothetical protein